MGTARVRNAASEQARQEGRHRPLSCWVRNAGGPCILGPFSLELSETQTLDGVPAPARQMITVRIGGAVSAPSQRARGSVDKGLRLKEVHT